jgi:hypothetical protein
MHKHFRDFVFAWLGPAWVKAQSKIKTDDDVKKFLSDAWDAYQTPKRPGASPFGKQWMP